MCLCFGVILGWVSGFVCVLGLCFGRGLRPFSAFQASCSQSVGFDLGCSYFRFVCFSDLVSICILFFGLRPPSLAS